MKVKRLPHAEGLPLPDYQSPDAAGFDLVAAIGPNTTVTILPGARALIPTGLIFEFRRRWKRKSGRGPALRSSMA